jgi:hypothetical protein
MKTGEPALLDREVFPSEAAKGALPHTPIPGVAIRRYGHPRGVAEGCLAAQLRQ